MLSLVVLCLAVSAVYAAQDFYCDFDNYNLCGFVQKTNDDFDWELNSYSTGSSNTGPTGDYSLAGKGYYLYTEASYPRNPDDRAIIETSQAFSFDGGNKCLKFKYHMYGSGMGYLDVYVGSEFVWWDGGNDLGQAWKSANIAILVSSGSHKISFEAWRGSDFKSDIAIDSVSLEDCNSGPVPPPTQAPPPPTTQAPTPPPPVTQAPPPTSGSCGIRPITRIVGGTDANHGDWPWQALLRYSSSGNQFCGGALVAPQWIVSASHCVASLSASEVHIRMGAHKRTSTVGTEQDFKVTKIIMHESYKSPKTFSNDIALLKLDKPAILDNYTNLVCLPPSLAITSGTKCWITGWGTTSSGGSPPETLQQAEVPIVHPDTCKASYPNEIDDTMVCAGLKQGGVDACQGDSGGPMVCESNGAFYLHGATSWGYGCAAPDKYGVYARVSHLRSWIDSKMANN